MSPEKPDQRSPGDWFQGGYHRSPLPAGFYYPSPIFLAASEQDACEDYKGPQARCGQVNVLDVNVCKVDMGCDYRYHICF